MEPHGVVDARALHVRLHEMRGVRQHGGAHESEVGGEGEHALVQEGIVRQRHLRFHPVRALRLARLQREGVDRVDGAQLDGPVGLQQRAVLLRHVGRHHTAQVQLAGQAFRTRHLGHGQLVIEAVFGVGERGHHGEDDLAVLDRLHRAGGEALAVAHALDLVDDRRRRVAGTQEVGMQRMRQALAVDRAAGRHQGLAQHLAAEHVLAEVIVALATEQVDFQVFQIEQLQQLLHHDRHSGTPSLDTRLKQIRTDSLTGQAAIVRVLLHSAQHFARRTVPLRTVTVSRTHTHAQPLRSGSPVPPHHPQADVSLGQGAGAAARPETAGHRPGQADLLRAAEPPAVQRAGAGHRDPPPGSAPAHAFHAPARPARALLAAVPDPRAAQPAGTPATRPLAAPGVAGRCRARRPHARCAAGAGDHSLGPLAGEGKLLAESAVRRLLGHADGTEAADHHPPARSPDHAQDQPAAVAAPAQQRDRKQRTHAAQGLARAARALPAPALGGHRSRHVAPAHAARRDHAQRAGGSRHRPRGHGARGQPGSRGIARAPVRQRDRLGLLLPGDPLPGDLPDLAVDAPVQRRHRAQHGGHREARDRSRDHLRAVPPQPHRLPAAVVRDLHPRLHDPAHRRRRQPQHAGGRRPAAPRRCLLPAPHLQGQLPLRRRVQRVPAPDAQPRLPDRVLRRGRPQPHRPPAVVQAGHDQHDPAQLPARPQPPAGVHPRLYRLREADGGRHLHRRAAGQAQGEGEPVLAGHVGAQAAEGVRQGAPQLRRADLPERRAGRRHAGLARRRRRRRAPRIHRHLAGPGQPDQHRHQRQRRGQPDQPAQPGAAVHAQARHRRRPARRAAGTEQGPARRRALLRAGAGHRPRRPRHDRLRRGAEDPAAPQAPAG
ncbi:UNVERIFIED_CONTAM: hypothetical protein NCL1_08867 [Trichonephila clavipes]